MDRRTRVVQKPAVAGELFAKLRKVQDELDAVRKDFVENTDLPGRRDDYLLILGSSVRLSLSLCRLLQSELEMIRKERPASPGLRPKRKGSRGR